MKKIIALSIVLISLHVFTKIDGLTKTLLWAEQLNIFEPI